MNKIKANYWFKLMLFPDYMYLGSVIFTALNGIFFYEWVLGS